MNRAELLHRAYAIYSQWMSRSAQERRPQDTHRFVEEMWSNGYRLAESQQRHRQQVIGVIWRQIIDS